MSYLADELAEFLTEQSLFNELANIDGEVFRDVAGRRTFRFVRNNKAYFAKVHFGVGWWEIVKNLLQLRLPVLGAKNEWRAVQKLNALSVETMNAVAYSTEGRNPARLRSCIVTEALDHTISLEDLVLNQQVTPRLKKQLVVRLAKTSKVLHSNGVNHRDYYLCHFLLSNDSLEGDQVNQLYLIDLHRVQIRRQVPQRWLEKDLAGLLFSAADAGLTRRDVYRFIQIYSGKPLREALKDDRRFWQRVAVKANRLYQKDQGKPNQFLIELDHD